MSEVYDKIRQAWDCTQCKGVGYTHTAQGAMTCLPCRALRDEIIGAQSDHHESMDIYSEEGAQVVFEYGLNGWEHDIQHARKYLTLGATYTVDYVDAGDSSSRLALKEFPNMTFNTVQFANVEKPVKQHDEYSLITSLQCVLAECYDHVPKTETELRRKVLKALTPSPYLGENGEVEWRTV